MSEALSPIDKAKAAAAQAAAGLVKDGMRVGLGTGSTAAWLVRALGGRVRHEGLRLTGVPTSERTAALAREAGIPLADLDGAGWLDLTIDGADEVDEQLNLIKGGGGALLREKIVATASERVVIIADAGKRVGTLGACPLPVEVVPFGWAMTRRLVEEALAGLDLDGREARLRLDGGEPFVTDGGHLILDLHLGRIGQPRQLGLVLNQIPGVVESGLFVGICDALVLGHADGRVEVQDPSADAARDLAQGLGTNGPAPDNIFTDVAD